MKQLNYSSLVSDPAADAAFEAALSMARSEVPDPFPSIVAGEPVESTHILDRPDPSHRDTIVSRAFAAEPRTVERAVNSARAASRDWRHVSSTERVDALGRVSADVRSNLIAIAGLVSAETGKSRLEALAEVEEVADLIDTYRGQFAEVNDFIKPLGTVTQNEHNSDRLLPYGVFGVIAPFNFPVALLANMTAAALITGNTVVLKPSDKTPRSGQAVADLFLKHLPAGVLNVLHGDAAVGRAIVESAVDGIAFTGSAEVGWGIVRKYAQDRPGAPVLAEMGGKNPALVASDADVQLAAEGVMRSAFGLSGQKCSACSRVVVDRSRHDELLEALAARAATFNVGDPLSRDSLMGPVIDATAEERFLVAVDDAARDGRVVFGGRQVGPEGFFVSPTVAADLPRNHDLTRRELFLPFVTVTAVDNFDEALTEANAVRYGLSAGVYSNSEETVARFFEEIQAGVTYSNRKAGATTGAWPGIQSFCGWKASGSTGKGGLGPWYLQGFMREQSRTVVTI